MDQVPVRRRSLHMALVGLATSLATVVALVIAPGPAFAATSMTLGPKTCTGSSYLYTGGTANYSNVHKIVTTSGYVAIRNHVNLTGTYQTKYYYPIIQGTVVRDGLTFVALSGWWPSGSSVNWATLSCDY